MIFRKENREIRKESLIETGMERDGEGEIRVEFFSTAAEMASGGEGGEILLRRGKTSAGITARIDLSARQKNK